jgi:dUTP pyrophosphatase
MPEAIPTVTTGISTAPPLLIKKLSPKARTPTRGSAFAAGYDLYSAQDITIPARGKAMVDTDLAIAVPVGTCEYQTWGFNPNILPIVPTE